MKQSILHDRELKPYAELAPTVPLRLDTVANVRLYADAALIAQHRRHFGRWRVIEITITNASWINETGAARSGRFRCGGFPGRRK